MASNPNWEQLFNKRNYCSMCGLDITFDDCDCKIDTPDWDSMEDTYDD